MTLPAPQPGLVLRYSYLWARDAEQGREQGGKDRPAVVVLVVQDATAPTPRVYVLPITHSQPAAGVDGIEIPITVAKTAGIDAARSWVIVSEFNEFAWPGFDLALVPGRKPALRVFDAGILRQGARPVARGGRCCQIAGRAAGRIARRRALPFRGKARLQNLAETKC